MSVKSVLITGCSSGIGYDAAHTLKLRDWNVFATCRKEVDCERLRGEGLKSVLLDYEDPKSIEAAVAHILEATDNRLDAIFNNGAFAIPGAIEDMPRGAFRQIFEANVFGLHDLVRLVVPVMRAQGHGRIIQCSSVLGFAAMKWRGTYVSTKFALEGYTDVLRAEMSDTDIKVIAIKPGPISTQIRKNSRVGFERWVDWKSSPRKAQYENQLMARLYSDDLPRDSFELPPSAVTKKLIHALEAPNPKGHYLVTTPTYIAAAINRLLPRRVTDWITARG
jgi:NAD(P)-dependent dehydrogenase (short-subunit alcohol dehydrogenase family)